MMDLFIIHTQLLTSQNINWWTGFVLLVNYCDICISCSDSHCDGTHSLQTIHWWTSDMMLNFSKSFSMKKQINLHLGCLRVNTFSANLEFWVNYSLKIFGKHLWNIYIYIYMCIFIPQKFFFIMGQHSSDQRWKVTNYIYSRYCNWVAFLCTCTFLSNFFYL